MTTVKFVDGLTIEYLNNASTRVCTNMQAAGWKLVSANNPSLVGEGPNARWTTALIFEKE